MRRVHAPREDGIFRPMTPLPATGLPIEPVLPALRDALRAGTSAVLQAPPGAGKTMLATMEPLSRSSTFSQDSPFGA